MAAAGGLAAAGVVARHDDRTIAALLALGARFDRDGTGQLALGREAAHGRARILHRPAGTMATGGIGHVYRHTTNPAENTGDGLAMAVRAGARLADLEFVQFHPTALDVGADPMPLLTEALRGAGATLVDELGRRLMTDRRCRRSGPRFACDARVAFRRGGPVPTALRTVSTTGSIRGASRCRRPRTTTWAAWRWTRMAARVCPDCGPVGK